MSLRYTIINFIEDKMQAIDNEKELCSNLLIAEVNRQKPNHKQSSTNYVYNVINTVWNILLDKCN